MNVLIVSTSDIVGGAAIAAHRLAEALNNNGVKARMMVLTRKGDAPYVIPVGTDRANRLRKLWERGVMWLAHGMKRKALFDTSIANTGYDITKTKLFAEADIVHLHWTCQGMLSMKGIHKILTSGKPVVWTMHDMWPLTAICHYTRQCRHFENACERCPQESALRPISRFSSSLWKKKTAAYAGADRLTFVTCSQWLSRQAKMSALTGGHRVVSIPNTINTHIFRKQDKELARRRFELPLDKHLLLFVAQSVSDERKGMKYLVEALRSLVEKHPDLKATTEVLLLGGKGEDVAQQLPLKTHIMGYMQQLSDIVCAYNAADIFVIPSTEDNLPNTVMEALACGVPCVGFDIGGIPEMIDHRINGYVASAAKGGDGSRVRPDVGDMANGLYWMLMEADCSRLSAEAVSKVYTTYAQQHVANLYIQEYNRLLPE